MSNISTITHFQPNRKSNKKSEADMEETVIMLKPTFEIVELSSVSTQTVMDGGKFSRFHSI